MTSLGHDGYNVISYAGCCTEDREPGWDRLLRIYCLGAAQKSVDEIIVSGQLPVDFRMAGRRNSEPDRQGQLVDLHKVEQLFVSQAWHCSRGSGMLVLIPSE